MFLFRISPIMLLLDSLSSRLMASKLPRPLTLFTLSLCYCSVTSVVYSVQPHRHQPPSFPRPLDSPGKNTGVGCHFLLQCMKVKNESEVAQLCPTLSDPMDCSLPGSSVHRIFQGRVLGWGAISFSDLSLYIWSILINQLIQELSIKKWKTRSLTLGNLQS